MQIAGTICYYCENKISFDNDGAYCDHCRTTYHRSCHDGKPTCPCCGMDYVTPESTLRYFKSCYVCGLKQNANTKQCEKCSSKTYAEDNIDHENKIRQIKSERYAELTKVILYFALIILTLYTMLGNPTPVGFLFLIIAISLSRWVYRSFHKMKIYERFLNQNSPH